MTARLLIAIVVVFASLAQAQDVAPPLQVQQDGAGGKSATTLDIRAPLTRTMQGMVARIEYGGATATPTVTAMPTLTVTPTPSPTATNYVMGPQGCSGSDKVTGWNDAGQILCGTDLQGGETPTPTPTSTTVTATPTPTVTATPTVTVTPTPWLPCVCPTKADGSGGVYSVDGGFTCGCLPTSTSTATPTPTLSPTPTVTATQTPTPTPTLTARPCASGYYQCGQDAVDGSDCCAFATPTVTATPTATVTATPTVTATATPTPTVTATPIARQRTFVVVEWGGSIPISTRTVESAFPNRLDPYTITEVCCEVDDATGTTINLQRDDGTPANILSSNLACATAIGSGCSSTFSGSEASIGTGQNVDFVLVTNSAGTRLNVTIKYTMP